MFKNRGTNLGALLLLLAIVPLQAGEALKDREDAAAVLARYFASGGRAEWTIESIDVDASLPKIAKGPDCRRSGGCCRTTRRNTRCCN